MIELLTQLYTVLKTNTVLSYKRWPRFTAPLGHGLHMLNNKLQEFIILSTNVLCN